MSRLAEFRAAEEQLRAQLQLLEDLKQDSSLQKEIEFESKLQSLMDEYHMNLGDIIGILDPNAAPKHKEQTPHPEKPAGKRRPRTTKRYQHPQTGEVIETKGGNHK
ncbi:transcriptional regulator, partial [Pseudomonas oryzihabitans]